MDVLIVYERKQRELEQAVLLQVELENRGYTCDIVQFYEATKFNFFNINPPKVILIPHLYNTRSVYRIFARFGHAKTLVNLQYEQVLSKKWEALGAHTPKGNAQDFFHICWGEKTVNRLIEGGVTRDNIRVFAPLHLDLLRKEYRQNSMALKASLSKCYKVDLHKNWVLFLSSFTYADIEPSRLKLNENAAGIKLSDFPGIHSKSRNELLVWFKRILEKDKSKVFIYRPHPDELSLEKIYKLEKEYTNFYVIRSEAVKDWISASDIVYSWYSTSVVEAHFLGKPYAILRPFSLPDSFDSVLLKHGHFITNYVGFEADYFQPLEQRGWAIDEEYIHKYYKVDKNTPSHKLLADFLETRIKLTQDINKFSFEMKSYTLAKIKLLGLYPIFALNKLFVILPFKGFKMTMGLFAQLCKEMSNQIASDAEKEKIKALFRYVISNNGK